MGGAKEPGPNLPPSKPAPVRSESSVKRHAGKSESSNRRAETPDPIVVSPDESTTPDVTAVNQTSPIPRSETEDLLNLFSAPAPNTNPEPKINASVADTTASAPSPQVRGRANSLENFLNFMNEDTP